MLEICLLKNVSCPILKGWLQTQTCKRHSMAAIPLHWPCAVFGQGATLCKLCPSFRSSPHLLTYCRHRVSVCRSTETVLGAHFGGLVFMPTLDINRPKGKLGMLIRKNLASVMGLHPSGPGPENLLGRQLCCWPRTVICQALHLRWGSTEASPLGRKQARLSPQPLSLTSPMATSSALEVCPSAPALQEGPHCSGPLPFSWLARKGPGCQPMGVLLPTVSKATSR